MSLVPAICTQCGGVLSIDDSKEAAICEYCGTPFVTEKAINHFNNQYHLNVNSGGNTIIIQNNVVSSEKNAENTSEKAIERLEKEYKVTITRKKHIFSASAVYFDFEVEGKHYILKNGGKIEFYTNVKTASFYIMQKNTRIDKPSESNSDFNGILYYNADGKDITIETDVTGFNRFLLKKITSSNRSVIFEPIK